MPKSKKVRAPKPPRELCEDCRVRPNDLLKHLLLPQHEVNAFIRQMLREGYVRARGVHAVVARVHKMYLRRGPANYTTDGVVNGIYIPLWAYEIARRVDARIGWREARIREMHNDSELAQAFLGALNLGSTVFDFFPLGDKERDPAATQGVPNLFEMEDAQRRAGTFKPWWSRWTAW